jgi:hypothetical protein
MSQSEEEKNLKSSRPVPPLSQLLVEQREVLDRIDKLLNSLPKAVDAYCCKGYEENIKRDLLLTLREEVGMFNRANHSICNDCRVTANNVKDIVKKVDKLSNSTKQVYFFSAMAFLMMLILVLKVLRIF